ncbi:hypothetical protein MNBD_GAMMA03-1428 [hydrothermal vent metagenome]|uniref:Uncharacterized protein n=1 Tax=hydrothermal vent metagenome TaxID=652676 RepID=A0A3B0WPR1_9ZZZZ
MNIALSTLLLFLFLLPGILYRRTYYSEEFSKEYFKTTFFGIFTSTFIPSLIFHTIWYYLANAFGYKVDLLILFDLFSKMPAKESILNIESYSLSIVIYNLSLFLTSILLGYLSKQLIRNCKWDRKYKQFRFQNSWHYILTGEFFDFPRSNFSLENDSVEAIEFIYVNILIDIDDAYLYDGILVDYELSKDGGLETITLKNCERRLLKSDCDIPVEGEKSKNPNKYPIDGHMLLFKYDEIKNINFSYYKLQEEEKENSFKPVLVG